METVNLLITEMSDLRVLDHSTMRLSLLGCSGTMGNCIGSRWRCDPAVTFALAMAEEFGGAFFIPSLRPDDCHKDNT